MKRSFSALALAFTGLASTALADVQSGELIAASGDATVFAVRAGETVSLTSGDSLYAGDRIMTSGDGTVTLVFGGCSVDLPTSSIVVLDDQFCDGGLNTPGFGVEAGFDDGISPLGVAVGIAAIAGVVTAIVVTGDDDDDDDTPTSP